MHGRKGWESGARRRLAGVAATAAALAMMAPGAAQASYSAVYAFGDSLSDNGNLYAATSAAYGAANALPQASGYWNGRFSNGAATVEVMAGKLGLSLVDFAYGGATTGTGPTYMTMVGPFDTGLQAQVANFDAAFGGVADANGLYFIWAGSNDLRDAFVTGDPAVMASTALDVISNLVTAIQHLYAEGARNFLLPTLPDFGLTPEGQASGVASLLSAFSSAFDSQLSSTYATLESLLPGASLEVFDTLGLQRAVQANPSAYGVGSVTTPCFTGYVGTPGPMCAAGFNTDAMYWDKVHPSSVTASVLGQAMAAQIPEPGSLLLSGLAVAAGLAASSSRRRQRAAVATA